MFLIVPPSQGKSRILAAIAVICREKTAKTSTIHIAFSSKILMETDEEIYKLLGKALGGNILLSVGIDHSKVKKDDVLILDEADWHLLDSCSKLPNCKKTYALSATTIGKEGGTEARKF